MIRLVDILIENYRSITEIPLNISFEDFTVIVGPNNCGKSNIIRALQLFFNGTVDGEPFLAEVDFPKNSNLLHTAQTKITLTVKYTADELSLIRSIGEIETQTKQKRLENELMRLRVSFSKRGVESWQFIGREGARNIKKELIYKVRDSLRHSVRFKYIPVGRDSIESIQHEIGEDLIRTIFSGWSGAVQKRREINDSISTLLDKLTPQLETTSDSLTESMQGVFHEIDKLKLKLPFNDLETMLPSLTPSLKDEYETSLRSKGAGLQTSSLLFFLKYLADNHPQRNNAKVSFLWAIEEPESFLHPAKQKGMAKIMKEFSSEVQTVITTHSPHFVPRGSDTNVYIVDKQRVAPYSTEIVGHDFETARNSLGVTLLDSMYLYPINIVVEGPSDEIILRGALEKVKNAFPNLLDSAEIRFFPAGNASAACSLFESLLVFGDTEETAIRLVIDGDSAGEKALRSLIERIRNTHQIHLISNKDYFQLQHDIEELTPKRIIGILEEERPAQVHIKRNINNKITHFQILDGHKKNVAKRIVELLDKNELEIYFKIFELIHNSLK